MGTSRLLLSSLLLVCLAALAFAADPYFQARCITGNYTDNSTYEANLNRVLSEFSTAANVNYNFYNLSAGGNSNQTNAIALCRGDIDQDSCNICLNESISMLRQECPNNKEAIGWSEYCTVRYANRHIYGTMETSPDACLYNVNNVTNVDRFNHVLSNLLTNLSSRAAAGGPLRKYAADNARTGLEFLRIYALVQCTPDLSESECSECLSSAIDGIGGCCLGKVGCRVLKPSCFLRFETSSFFQTPTLPSQPPPPPSSPPLLSTTGNGDNSSRTIIVAVVFFVAGAATLMFCVCLFLKLRKPWEKLENPTSMEEDHLIRLEDKITNLSSNVKELKLMSSTILGKFDQLLSVHKTEIKDENSHRSSGDSMIKGIEELKGRNDHKTLI